jgi:hypothetical protein
MLTICNALVFWKGWWIAPAWKTTTIVWPGFSLSKSWAEGAEAFIEIIKRDQRNFLLFADAWTIEPPARGPGKRGLPATSRNIPRMWLKTEF